MRLPYFLLGLGCLLVTCASPARASDDPRKPEAQRLFDVGQGLHFKKQDVEALKYYRQSYETYPSPNVLFAIARSEQLTGEQAAALRHYREAMRSPLQHPDNIPFGKKYIDELTRLVGQIRFSGSIDRTVAVYVDGDKVEQIDEPYAVEPGAHTVEARDRVSRRVAVKAGETVDFDLTPAPHGEAPGKGSVPSDHGSWGPPIASYVAAGVGLVALATGVGLALSSRSKSDSISGHQGTACPNGSESPACQDLQKDIDSRNATATWAWVAYSASAAAFGAAAAFWIFWPSTKSSSATSLVPVVAPQSAGLHMRVAF